VNLHASIPWKWLPALNRFVVARDWVVEIARRPAAAGWTDDIGQLGLGAAQIVLCPAFATLVMHDFFRSHLFAFWALHDGRVVHPILDKATKLVLAMSALVIVAAGLILRALPEFKRQDSHSGRGQNCRHD
jgi:hypothetical protein